MVEETSATSVVHSCRFVPRDPERADEVREKVRWFFDDRARQLESPAYDVTFSRRGSLEPREMFWVMTIEPRWGKQGSGPAPGSFKALAAELENVLGSRVQVNCCVQS